MTTAHRINTDLVSICRFTPNDLDERFSVKYDGKVRGVIERQTDGTWTARTLHGRVILTGVRGNRIDTAARLIAAI